MFTTTTKHGIKLATIEIPEKSSKRLHLVGVRARVSEDIKLKYDTDYLSASIKKQPFDGPKGIWIVEIKSKNKFKSVKLSAEHKSIDVAEINLNIVKRQEKILPPSNTKKGLLTRLFLAESITPNMKGKYAQSDVAKGMLWMRCVIENRLKHKTPNIFGAQLPNNQTEYNIESIVTAKNQFHGFEAYPKLNSKIQVNLTGFYAIANNYNHSERDVFIEFIESAERAASDNALKSFVDPSKNGLYGWRTQASSHPGGSFVKFRDFVGQTFYSLDK